MRARTRSAGSPADQLAVVFYWERRKECSHSCEKYKLAEEEMSVSTAMELYCSADQIETTTARWWWWRRWIWMTKSGLKQTLGPGHTSWFFQNSNFTIQNFYFVDVVLLVLSVVTTAKLRFQKLKSTAEVQQKGKICTSTKCFITEYNGQFLNHKPYLALLDAV